MAKGEGREKGYKNLIPFKKGDVNIYREGRPRKNPCVRMVVDALQQTGVKKVTRSDAESLVFTMLNMTMEELAEIAQGKIRIKLSDESDEHPAVYEECQVPYLAQALAMDILGAKSNSRTMANLIDDMRQSTMAVISDGQSDHSPLLIRVKG